MTKTGQLLLLAAVIVLRDKVIAEETEKYEAVTNELKQKGIPIPENKE